MKTLFSAIALDVTYDFTEDVYGYKNEMKKDKLLGTVPSQDKFDPDKVSNTLWEYQYRLYNGRTLPNGETFDLVRIGRSLSWNGIDLGNDSIIVSLRWPTRYPEIKKIAMGKVQGMDFRKWVDKFIPEAYTIGGEMLFPSKKIDNKETINQARGFSNKTVADRFDVTLSCIKAYYEGIKDLRNGELNRVLDAVWRNNEFFQIFVDFKGYVDFFYLQDCLDSNGGVIDFIGHKGYPKIQEYDTFISKQMEFLRKRNLTISKLDV